MKKILSVFLALAVILCSTSVAFALEDTTAVEISSAAQFAEIANNLSGSYKLTANITITAGITGTFTGTFDGNGHTITIGSKDAPAVQGVFAKASNFTIKNLTVKGAVNATAKAGTFVGDADGTATFINCTNFADVTSSSGASYVGGILGDGYDSCTAVTFENCTNYGTVYTYDSSTNIDTGGLIGVGKNTKIKNSANYGTVSGKRYVGGLIGWSTNKLEVSNCANFGKIASRSYGSRVGGVVGNLGGSSTGYIKNFFNAGQATNGVAGSDTATENGKNVSISYCVNVGTTTNAITNVKNATTSNCYYLQGKGSDLTGATAKTSDELKALTLEGFSKQEGFDYSLPSGIEYVSKEDATSLTKISTADDFKNIASDLAGTYKLTKDIDLSNCGYVAISGFKGTLDGSGYTVNLGNNATQGIFASASNFTIKNLTVKGTINSTTKAGVGAFVGAAPGAANFINCKNFANIKIGAIVNYVGGILGNGYDGSSGTTATFENCINYGDIDATGFTTSSIGGIAGVGRNAVVKDSLNYGTVAGRNRAGGLVGWNTTSLNVSDCANFGKVSSISYGSIVGGVLGYLQGSATITKFLNAGQVNQGVVGYRADGTNGTPSISYCVNVGPTNNTITNLPNVTTTNCYFLEGKGKDATGATAKTSAELKELEIEGFSVPTDIYGVEYPVPSTLTLTTNNVTVSASEGGSVSPSGLVKVNYGRNVTFKVTPEDGYYLDDCSYNGAVIALNSSNAYATPAITANATFDAQFARLTDIDVSDALTTYNPYNVTKEDTEYYGDNGAVITFAKAAKFAPLTVEECGILVDTTNSLTDGELVYGGEGVKVLTFDFNTYSLSTNGCYGVLIYNNNFTAAKTYKVRSYAKYSNGKIAYGNLTEVTFDAINAQ